MEFWIENIFSLFQSTAEYKAKVNKDCQVKLDTENWIPADRTGGLEILAQKGKIKVDNTLEARLEMISQQILPSIREKLFGSNPNRLVSGQSNNLNNLLTLNIFRKFTD